MGVSPQRQEKIRRRFIVITIALVFSATWTIIGILSMLNFIQTTWSSISSAIFVFLGVVIAVSQWLFPLPPLKESNNSPSDTGTQLRLVEVSATEEPRIEDGRFLEIKPQSEERIIQLMPRRLVKLDFKLRNIGTQVGFLKRADFRILDVATFLDPPDSLDRLENIPIRAMRPVSLSANYDAPDDFLPEPKLNDSLLEPALRGRSMTINLSQAIAPNEVDRFTITIGNQGNPDRPPTWYLFRVNLIYDETNKFLETETILLSIPPIPPPGAHHPVWASWLEIFTYPPNRETAQKFLQVKAIKSPSVEFVRQHYLDDDSTRLR